MHKDTALRGLADLRLFVEQNALSIDTRLRLIEVIDAAVDAVKIAACPHGYIDEAGMCEQCYIESDLAYDSRY